MMKTNKIIRSIELGGALLLLACFLGVSFGAEPIKVGVVDALSGWAAAYGVNLSKGREVARDDYNAAGGILGRRIQFIVRDHMGRSDVARRVAEELVLKEKVDFLLGCSVTPCGMAVSEVAKQYKVLFVDSNIKSPEATEQFGHRYIASVAADSVYEGGAMATLEKDTPRKAYWMIAMDYAYGHNVVDEFKKKLKGVKPDAKIIGESWVKVGETELTPYITKILASKADGMAGVLMAISFQNFFKQQAPYGLLKKVHMINGGVMASPEFLYPIAKEIPDGVVLNTWHLADYPDTPINRNFVKHYLNATGDAYVPGSAAQAYIASQVLFEAIKKAGTTDTEKVVDALSTIAIETPRSTEKIGIRQCDQRSNLGELWGATQYDSASGQVKLVNPRYISAEGLHHTCSEVMNIRAQKK